MDYTSSKVVQGGELELQLQTNQAAVRYDEKGGMGVIRR
jgi:hypothetical protein